MSKDTGEIVVNGIRTRLDRVGCCNRCGKVYSYRPTITPSDPGVCEGCGHIFCYGPGGIARDLTRAELRQHLWNSPRRDYGMARQEKYVERLIG